MVEGRQQMDLSVVVPAHNEQDNVRPLVEQILAAVAPMNLRFEIIIIDDGSIDGTPRVLSDLLSQCPSLRVIRFHALKNGKGRGQSAAFHAGFRASHGRLIATLDADLQNDPADIPRLVELLCSSHADMIQGDRSAARRDGLVRRVSSRVGRLFRCLLLADTIRDTGCSIRVMKREVALQLPLNFRGMHRFIPITARQVGYNVIETPVNHRPRATGRTNYGIWNRALPGLIDCVAVRWMCHRRTTVDFEEILPSQPYGREPAAARQSIAEMSQP